MTGGLNCAGKVTLTVTLEIPQGHANERAQVLDVRQPGRLRTSSSSSPITGLPFDLPKSGSADPPALRRVRSRSPRSESRWRFDVNGVAESRAVLLEQPRGPAAKLIEGTALGSLPVRRIWSACPWIVTTDPTMSVNTEAGTGREPVVGMGTTCGTHRTADDQLAFLLTRPPLSSTRAATSSFTVKILSTECACASAHERRIRAGTEQQPQAREHHRLTGTRFAGHNDETRPKIDVSGLDNTQMRNIERPNHRGPSSTRARKIELTNKTRGKTAYRQCARAGRARN